MICTVRAGFACALVLSLGSSLAGAQTITSPTSAKTIVPWDEYATQVIRDPWDMSDRTDIGFFTWGLDQPTSNMTSKQMAADTFGQTIFTAAPITNDPSIFLLDSYSPGTARVGRTGALFPIPTSQYTRLLIKMRVGTEIKPPAFGQIGTVPVMQVYWSRDTIYFDSTLRPTGGTYTTVDVAGNQVGLPFTSLSAEPFGGMEGGHYVIYSIPVGSIAGMQAINANIAKWHNVNANNAAVDVNWGASPSILGDSLRFKPVNLNGAQAGAIDIDWVRLVAPGGGAAETVSWSGGGTFDIVISTASDCGASNGQYAVLAYSKTTGYQFNPQTLPNGKYYVGLRDRMTANGADSPASRLIRACSATVGGSYSVVGTPAFTFTSPNPDGSSDDFATTFLNNPWDLAAPSDIDHPLNISALWNANVPLERVSGAPLGTVPLLFGTSVQAQPGMVGDPYVYPLFSTARGLNTRIDTNRYRLFSTDIGIDHERDLVNGSVLRIGWHIAGETWTFQNTTQDAENITKDIALRHMKKGAFNLDAQAGNYVVDRIKLDLADRFRVPLEDLPNGSPSMTGWSNTMTQCGAAGCSISRVQPFDRFGLDDFRIDLHEFSPPTTFYMGVTRLTAHERSGSVFPISWTFSLPPEPATGSYSNPANWKVRFYVVRTKPESSPGAGDASASTPVTTNCASNPGVDTFQISPNGVQSPVLTDGTFSWNAGPAGLVNGALYFICAGLIRPGDTLPSTFTLSDWPIVFAPGAATAALPRLVVDRSTVWMAARHTGAQQPPNLSSRTPPQTINVTQIGGVSGIGWLVDVCQQYDPNNPPVCTGSLDYIQLSTTSGAGTQAFTVQLRDSAVLPASTGTGLIAAVLRIREAGGGTLGNSPQYVQLYAKIYGPGDVTSAPLGQMDSPAQGQPGVQGTVGISGWVVDDVGMSVVQIYRNCLPASEPASCATNVVPGAPTAPVVYLGDAAFVPGARPDVEAAFSTFPGSGSAGWGLSVLTNMLPRTAGPFAAFGGQGPITFYAIGIDAEGQRTLLGRSWQSDHTPTSIVMDNDSLAKPFGSIDTPGQGGTGSGSLANFGWVLTPDKGTGALVPTNGSTMFVYVDGVAIGNVTYNQCRGTVGNPPPAGVYCNDDVANIFGNVTPQPPLTPRTSNPSQFRNLDAARGPQGSFAINTALYANGLHSLAWSATDSLGRVEGIGSRNFIVNNGVGRPGPEFSARPGRELGERVSDLDVLERLTATVGVRTGWDMEEAFSRATRARGAVQIAVPASRRIEMGLPDTPSGATWEGYAIIAGRLRQLPAGSALDPHGRFTWQPLTGHYGTYDLLFVRENTGGTREALPVRVVLGAQ